MSEVTIYTLAKKLNMSPSAVSRAFNPSGRVSAEKRALVLAEAERLGYSPNKHASRLSMRGAKIGIIINSNFEPAIEEMKRGAQLAYESMRDYKIQYELEVISPKHTGLSEYGERLLKYADCDGVIISGMSAPKYAPYINALYEKNKNIVQVQAANPEVGHLFSSKHNEREASRLAADILSCCLFNSRTKRLLLFTGDAQNALHSSAKEEFVRYSTELGMSVIECIDMRDDEEYFENILPSVFEKNGEYVEGIYITSGFCDPLCKYLEKRGLKIPLVTFDNYSSVKEYIKKGIIFASVEQDVSRQISLAFTELARYIITKVAPDRVVYTDIRLCLRSNMEKHG